MKTVNFMVDSVLTFGLRSGMESIISSDIVKFASFEWDAGCVYYLHWKDIGKKDMTRFIIFLQIS
jgi:hypothetical protein